MQFVLLGLLSLALNLNMLLFGEIDYLLKAFFSILIIDYITGILKAIKKRGLSPYIAILGVIKKIGYICVVVTSVILGNILEVGSYLRDIVLYSFLFNEMLSILGNCKELGIVLPSILQKSLEKIDEKTNKE